MIYFASDFHLGVPDYLSSRKREDKICRWLDMAAQDATEIYLLGDVFDFWFEYKQVVPRGFVRLLGKLAELTDRGIQITMFKGNHDMWMFGYLTQECGVKIVSNELEISRNEKTFYLHHGDGLGPGDKLYKLLRTLFRSRVNQWLFERLHPNFGMGLGNYLSRRSRISQKGRYEEYMGDDSEFLLQHCKQLQALKSYDYMIFGHRHLVLDISVGNGRYINLGEWVSGCTYAKFDGTELKLNKFQP